MLTIAVYPGLNHLY